MRHALAFALALVLGSAGASAGEPSRVVFPEQALPISFSHRQHLAKNIQCTFCHDRAPDSTSARDHLIPPEEQCADCHAIDRTQPHKQARPAARCDACHPGFSGHGEPPRVAVPPPNLKFNHKLHADRKIPCLRCHGSVAAADLATRADLPRMTLCLECHDGKQAPSRCTTCHVAGPDGTLRLVFPTGKLAPSGVLRGDAHTPRFRLEHARTAQGNDAYCASCHRRSFCLDCHNGVVKPFDFHGNDYVTLHALDARKNDPDCSSCHRRQTFCVGCHQRTGVAFDRPGGQPGLPTGAFGVAHGRPGQLHPPGFARDASGAPTGRADPGHHSFQAQRNVRACASCHREETCLRCHAASSLLGPGGRPPQDTAAATREPGFNVSPHGPGFAGSARCRALSARNLRACVKCHDPRDGKLQCW